jgi:hypothetical protein
MKKNLLFTIVISMLLAATSCKKEEEPAKMVDDSVPAGNTLAKGNFSGFQHSLAGSSSVVKDSTGNIFLRLENFTMTSGPDVYVYMSKSTTYSGSQSIEVRKLEGGFTDSNITIDIDNNLDYKEYKYVLVYCFQFSALFGRSELN